jgi:hypothetical protein
MMGKRTSKSGTTRIEEFSGGDGRDELGKCGSGSKVGWRAKYWPIDLLWQQ